jgi:PKD repeat protein
MNRIRSLTRGRHLAPALAALTAVVIILAAGPYVAGQVARTGWTVVAWNNLGMHCMDADFSVFAILPPYNTIQAQVMDASGHLVTSASGITLTYQGVADPSGSINTTSSGKTNFWSFVLPLFGVSLPVNVGLLNHNMPAGNGPQPMVFDPALNWFIAEGIPITPYDDAGKKNYYPLMKVTASDGTGAALASTNIVLPVSDEMDCRACHASGSGAAARPAAGWVFDADAQRDYRLNVLRIHDDRQLGSANFTSALAAKGYSASGLYATATGGKAILCAACHKSEALAGSGITGIAPLTSAMHTLHGQVADPTSGQTLEANTNRTACYRCHPGSETRCLRGAMGNAVAANGTMAIQCQNCHGPMSAVGSPARTGWLQEPTCQSCHTGTATSNAGAIRFTSVFDASGQTRTVTNTTFATAAGAPAPGLSLYRFSAGHGGLQCSACHGSTHAEFPSSHPNDNLQSVALQGHAGMIAECGTCHTAGVPSTTNGGPHGMHPVGQAWVSGHHDAINGNLAQCQACHGTDNRGTVLSRTFGARTLSAFGTKALFKGAQVGCYTCHNGPSNSNANANRAPVASNATASTTSPNPVAIPLVATDPDGNALTLRIVSQPANGTVGLSGTTATYFPFAGTSGTDTFTFAAWDGSIDSNLATVTVTVGGSACTLTAGATVPGTAAVNTPVSFTGTAAAGANCAGTVAYDWNFGDGTAHATTPNASHAYAAAGTFQWTLTETLGTVTATRTGSIVVSAPGGCTLSTTASVPASGTVNSSITFTATAAPGSGCAGGVTYDWSFGDGTARAATQNASHTYTATGTFQWTMTATVSGVTSTKTGSIVISTVQAAGPTITGTRQLSEPFRVEIDGTNFQAGVQVFIGTDTTRWPTVTRASAQRLILGGTGLSSRFPRGATVTIRVVNPDGKSATTTFRRRSG